MPDEYKGKHLELWTPTTHRIELEGYLDENWSERLAGMQVKKKERINRP